MIPQYEFYELIKKFMSSKLSQEEFYNEVKNGINMSDDEFDKLHRAHHETLAELKRTKTRYKNLKNKQFQEENRLLRADVKRLKEKINIYNMDVEKIKILKTGDLVTYVSSVSDAREELEISGEPFFNDGRWYVNLRTKGSESEGVPTLAAYLEKIGNNETDKSQEEKQEKNPHGVGSLQHP